MTDDHRKALREIATECYDCAQEKGWHEKRREPPELIALMHSELSEALEAFRRNNPLDEQCNDFGNAEIELADTIIRIFDAGGTLGLDIPGAMIAKITFNRTRPHRHGGKRY